MEWNDMCTIHSVQRANERTRYSGKTAVRFIEKGLERGKTSESGAFEENGFPDAGKIGGQIGECGMDQPVRDGSGKRAEKGGNRGKRVKDVPEA